MAMISDGVASKASHIFASSCSERSDSVRTRRCSRAPLHDCIRQPHRRSRCTDRRARLHGPRRSFELRARRTRPADRPGALRQCARTGKGRCQRRRCRAAQGRPLHPILRRSGSKRGGGPAADRRADSRSGGQFPGRQRAPLRSGQSRGRSPRRRRAGQICADDVARAPAGGGHSGSHQGSVEDHPRSHRRDHRGPASAASGRGSRSARQRRQLCSTHRRNCGASWPRRAARWPWWQRSTTRRRLLRSSRPRPRAGCPIP